MDTISSTAAAPELGVSVPTLHRALRRVGGVSLDARGWIQIDAETMARLRRHFGTVPAVPGLTRAEVQVLIALSRHPRGLVSVRQTALASRVSPTAASRALVVLEDAGLAKRVRTRLFDGRVEDRDVHTIDWRSPAWPKVAPLVASAVLPAPRRPSRHGSRLPSRLARDFWTGDWRTIDVTAQPVEVARRILHEGRDDPEALAFLGELPAEAVRYAIVGSGTQWRRAERGRGVPGGA